MSDRIRYRKGYKYQLAEGYHLQLDHIRPVAPVDTPYISLSETGLLIIKRGYAWDGPSGPTIDTKDAMRAALVHDALYQLMREGHVERQWRDETDALFYSILLADGMNPVRAKLWYDAVRVFAAAFIDPANERQIITAP